MGSATSSPSTSGGGCPSYPGRAALRKRTAAESGLAARQASLSHVGDVDAIVMVRSASLEKASGQTGAHTPEGLTWRDRVATSVALARTEATNNKASRCALRRSLSRPGMTQPTPKAEQTLVRAFTAL
ncbi:hypothetical protein FOA52_012830 [Chlamydomonas sp. UWO 241]|nr:hypothetical protein FOA52_012830 [Chlamydomonas sp. UWO 241]